MAMKKLLLVCLPILPSGCSVHNQFVEHIQTGTLEYHCDRKLLTMKLDNTRQTIGLIYDNRLLSLKQGASASGARYTDGIRVLWPKGNEATIYKRDRTVLNDCQLQNLKR